MTFVVGAIADDFTGATDLASALRKRGLRVLQLVGPLDSPASDFEGTYDALVVALKSRMATPREAVRLSVESLRWLMAGGCDRYYFKYCSTFDSTPKGNIGPVAEALLAELGESATIICPALPANGRTVYKSTLFVGDARLDESGMRDHPLTPMRDSNLLRLLEPQVMSRVGRLDYSAVRSGVDAVRQEVQALIDAGVVFIVADAITDDDLRVLGQGVCDFKLVTGSSGLALGIPVPDVNRISQSVKVQEETRAAIFAGSSSAMTNAQVEQAKERIPSFRVRAMEIARGDDVVGEAVRWARARAHEDTLMFYATDTPENVGVVQAALGVEQAGKLVEQTLAGIAAVLVNEEIETLIVAGGETSGAVVQALGIRALEIGDDLAPGVPWTYAIGTSLALKLALKSGNFGSADFFLRARGIA